MNTIKDHEVRFYTVPPEKKSIETCALHGSEHALCGWSRQIDPGWTNAQKQAYIEAYLSHKSNGHQLPKTKSDSVSG